MSKIDLHNYESFILDYREGRLSANEELLLFEFLNRHPEKWEEFEASADFVSLKSAREEVSFPYKEKLRRPLVSEADLIAYSEGILSEQQAKTIEKISLEDEHTARELKLFRSAKFSPESDLVFPDKQLLYREAQIISFAQYRYYAVAAALILIFGLTLLFITQNDTAEEQLISNTNSKRMPIQKQPVRYTEEKKAETTNQDKSNIGKASVKPVEPVTTNQMANSIPKTPNRFDSIAPQQNIADEHMQLANATEQDHKTEGEGYYYANEWEEDFSGASPQEQPKPSKIMRVLGNVAKGLRLAGNKNVESKNEVNEEGRLQETFALGTFEIKRSTANGH